MQLTRQFFLGLFMVSSVGCLHGMEKDPWGTQAIPIACGNRGRRRDLSKSLNELDDSSDLRIFLSRQYRNNKLTRCEYGDMCRKINALWRALSSETRMAIKKNPLRESADPSEKALQEIKQIFQNPMR